MKKNQKIKNILLVLAGILVLGFALSKVIHSAPTAVDLGEGYRLDTNSFDDLGILNNKNSYVVYGHVIEYKFDSQFILASERPREKIEECKSPTATLAQCDEAFNKSTFRQFYIIDKAEKTVYGPYSLEQYLLKRNETGVPKELELSNLNSSPTTDSFFVVDADSGAKVVNPSFVVNGTMYNTIDSFLAYMNSLPNGKYDVSITASDYTTSEVKMNVPENLKNLEINLSPLTKAHNCSRHPSKTNNFFLCGYVVDENRSPLAGVQIASPDFSDLKATSGADGYYEAEFPPKKNYDCGDKATFTFTKPGFKTLDYTVEGPIIYIGGDIGFRHMMKTGTGIEQIVSKHGICS